MMNHSSRPTLFANTAAVCLLALLAGSCALFTGRSEKGAVTFHRGIPDNCDTTRGLKQKVVKRVTSEEELRRHYGLTFLVQFQDGVSPRLYGTLYHQNEDANFYCMALPDGRFATFSDSKVGDRNNVSQEVCFPIKEC